MVQRQSFLESGLKVKTTFCPNIQNDKMIKIFEELVFKDGERMFIKDNSEKFNLNRA